MSQERKPSRVSRRERTKGERTRQHIIAEAAPLFNRMGYEGCSIQEVMVAAGVEKGGLYRHFSSKEELAVEAFDHAWAEVSRTRTIGLEEITDPLERIEAFIRNFVERRPSLPGGCPLLNTAIDADDGNRALRARARAALQGWHRRLTQALQQARRQGTLGAAADPARLATVIISTLEGSLMFSRLEEDPVALGYARDHLIEYLTKLRTGKRRQPA
jgi:TetR/AcrR family transcriptional regulator, transcriptional repressor for nem operon